ncbi:PAS domain S-box protein [Marinobacterium rhizophilum]|uniref:PAS domain S-box protein n=1 Tax=Marinobacterium rhizophilum TaxID=420402 RepID=UPI000370EFB6|nr:PAS domain S-box protein [Marinobacterium rhizophilum]
MVVRNHPINSVTQLTAILNSVPTAIIVADQHGTIVLVNAQAERLFGYTATELLGEMVDILLPARYRAGHPELRAGFMHTPKNRPMGAGRDLFGLRKDGIEFPIEIGLNPITTDEGILVVSAIVDITERKRMEARFRATVESAPTAMVMIDQTGTILLVNAEMERLFGYHREELLQHKIEVLLPERFKAAHPGMRASFFTTPESRRMGAGRDLFAARKDGTEFPVEIGLNPVNTDEGQFVLAAILDISERKRLETLFRATVESAPIAMVMIDATGTIQLVNSEMERLFGYERQALLHQKIEVLIPQRYRAHHPGLRTGFFDTPQARRMGAGRDLNGLRRDGTEFPVEIGLNPVQTEDGTLVLAAIIDLTERQRAADAALQRTNEALERSNIELQRFAYVASHDLQTPMRNVASFVELLQSSYTDQLDAQANDWIRRIVQSVKQLQTLVRDLLEYSRVDSQAHPFTRVPGRAVFDAAVTLLESSIRESGAQVSCGELPVLTGDRSQLVQLLINLIGNSLKYRGNEAPKIRIEADRLDAEWRLMVQDNGIGIDPRYHDRIFEIFERLHDQRSHPGSGIGLAVCRRVVHRHGGRIWVESEPGTGSRFYFTIPEQEGHIHE